MPQTSYLVRTQLTERLSNPTTGFNAWLQKACESQAKSPQPYAIDWSDESSNFWTSYVKSEDLDQTSAVGDGTLCLMYGLTVENGVGTVAKFAVFSGIIEIGVAFDIAWDSQDAPKNGDGLADATDDAFTQAMNAAAYYASFGEGVMWNGLFRVEREPLRQSGPGWRQRLAYRLTFEVQV